MSELTFEDFEQLDILTQTIVSLVFTGRRQSGVRVISPPDWKAKAEGFPEIRFADARRREEAIRILQKDAAEEALKELINASHGELRLAVFVKAIIILADDKLKKRLTRDEAKKVVNAARTLKRYAPVMLDKSWTEFLLPRFQADARTKRQPGRKPLTVPEILSAHFRKHIGRPVHPATAALLNAVGAGKEYDADGVTTGISRRKKKLR